MVSVTWRSAVPPLRLTGIARCTGQFVWPRGCTTTDDRPASTLAGPAWAWAWARSTGVDAGTGPRWGSATSVPDGGRRLGAVPAGVGVGSGVGLGGRRTWCRCSWGRRRAAGRTARGPDVGVPDEVEVGRAMVGVDDGSSVGDPRWRRRSAPPSWWRRPGSRSRRCWPSRPSSPRRPRWTSGQRRRRSWRSPAARRAWARRPAAR